MAEISIIIPVFNAGQKLQKCLNSIVKQTYQDYEVILVDDGSQDQSGIICDRFARKDFRFHVIHQENRGSVAARKRGIEVATGEFCSFCDADDTLPKNSIETMILAIQDSDICIGNLQRMWHGFPLKNYQIADCFKCDEPERYSQQEFISTLYCSWFGISNVPVNLCGKLFRTELIREAYCNTASIVRFYGDDLIVTMNAIPLVKEVCIIPNVIYNYRVGGGTSQYNPHMLEDWLALYQYKKQFAKRYQMPQNIPYLMDVELCNMMMTYWQMLAACGKFQEEQLRRMICETLQIDDVLAAAWNSDIPNGKCKNVDLIRKKDADPILSSVLSAQKRRKKMLWIKNILYKLA